MNITLNKITPYKLFYNSLFTQFILLFQMMNQSEKIQSESENELGWAEQTSYEICILDERYRNQIEEFSDYEYVVKDISSLSKAIQSQDILDRHYGIIGIHKLLQENVVPPIQQVIDAGLAPIIATLISQKQYLQIQMQAAAVLAIISNGNRTQFQLFKQLKGASLIASLFESQRQEIIEFALFIVGSIIQAADISNQIFVEVGIATLSNVLKIMRKPLLVNFCCNGMSFLYHHHKKQSEEQTCLTLSSFCQVITDGRLKDKLVISKLLWVMQSQSDTEPKKQTIVKSGVINKLVKYVGSITRSIMVSAIKVLTNISMHDSSVIDEVINCGALDQVLKVMIAFSSQRYFRLPTFLLMRSLSTGSKHHCERLIHHPKLLEYALKDIDLRLILNLLLKAPSEELFNILASSQIFQYMANQLENMYSPMYEEVLRHSYSIFLFGEKYKKNGENVFVSAFTKSGGYSFCRKGKLTKAMKLV